MNNHSHPEPEGSGTNQIEGRRQSRREREFMRHMDEIIEAAEFVFAEKGYSSATMEEIAQRAEFAVGTIYKFFPGKGDLYAETILRGFRQRETQVYETLSSSDSPQERIERYLQCRLSQFWENPNFFRLFFQGLDRVNGDLQAGILADLTARYRKLKERLRQIFAEGIRQGQFQNYDPGVLTVALEGLIRGYVIQLTLQVNPSRDGDQERQLAQLFLHGAAGLSNSSKGVY